MQREFYAEMCRIEHWSTRTLEQKIGGMLYERTAISKKPEAVVEMEIARLRELDRVSADLVFRDPYLLDFLGLQGAYSERDMEAAILEDRERFLLEMGDGFCFVARQKRMIIGADDFYLDLLFYHRKLRRLVVVELKLEKSAAVARLLESIRNRPTPVTGTTMPRRRAMKMPVVSPAIAERWFEAAIV